MCIMSCLSSLLFSSNGYSIKKLNTLCTVLTDFTPWPVPFFRQFYIPVPFSTILPHVLFFRPILYPCTIFSLIYPPVPFFWLDFIPCTFLETPLYQNRDLFTPCTKIGIFNTMYQMFLPPVPKWAFPPPPHFLME